MFKKIFLALIMTHIVCQPVMAGFFKCDPKDQLKTAIRASSYSNFETIFKQSYQRTTNEPGFFNGWSDETLPAKFQFSDVKQEVVGANTARLADLREKYKEDHDYNFASRGLVRSIMAAGAAYLMAGMTFVLPRELPYHDYVNGFNKLNTALMYKGFFAVSAIAFARAAVSGARQCYDGINYKSYIQKKIDNNEQIKTLIINTHGK